MGYPFGDELIEPQGARHLVHQGQHVAAEGVLQLGVLVEVVHHHARLGVALEDDDQPLPGASRGVVANVGDTGQAPGVHQVGDLLGQIVRVAHVRQFGDHQGRASLGVLLDVDHRAHRHRATPGAVGILDALTPDDQRTSGEVRPLDAGHRGRQ